MQTINGFSKLDKNNKILSLTQHSQELDESDMKLLKDFWNDDIELQKIFDDFSENTLSNFYMPYGIAPNFLVNDRLYAIPMVIEESSVVAAASKSAKFWINRGGFKYEVESMHKVGNIHFFWKGEDSTLLEHKINKYMPMLMNQLKPFTVNMEKRGGGVKSYKLVDMSRELEHYYKIEMCFDTCDAMGANFINTILEESAKLLVAYFSQDVEMNEIERTLEINMCILSNYTPDCVVRAWVECDVEDFKIDNNTDPTILANKFVRAVNVANVDPYRAVTHNKGIMNGIDSLILATGNDFRAVEACAHAYAARSGQYRSLTSARIENNKLIFELKIPLAIGVIGGLTKLHPLAKLSLKILGTPSAKELMGLVAVVGLAQNFGALRSLTTTGIQKGHMKMHLLNICKQLLASDEETQRVKKYFEDKVVSFNAVRDFIQTARKLQ